MSAWWLAVLVATVTCAHARICSSVDIRNKPDRLEALRGCRVVEGYVQIVLMERGNETDFDLHSLPELREITEYLMFYRVVGLRNIGQIFPNLSVIRGESLFQDYALVVFEMFNLQEVGLRSLAEITRGAVRIEKNPRLCYVDTVDWDQVARWDPVKNYISQNKPADSCPGCDPSCPQGLCWSLNQCQIQNVSVKSHCHPLCVGDCLGPGPKGCYTCRKFLTADNECVEQCPVGTYEYLNRRCITADECFRANQSSPSLLYAKEHNYVTFNGTCTDRCPAGFQLDDVARSCVPCRGKCSKTCPPRSIDNIAAAQKLRGCTHIEGSLEITIRSGKPEIIAQELEENLGDIQEITGFLKIARSSPIVNLHFLKNLMTIGGERENYAMLVLENQNLQELWDWETKPNFKILKSRLFFHDNPKLCMHHISKLIEIVNQKNVTDVEVSKESNGYKVPCNAASIHLTVKQKTSNSIQIRIPSVDVHSNHSFLRYVVYYIKDPGKNISKFDDLDQCSDYGWMSKDISVDLRDKMDPLLVNLTNLEPYTQYSFYVTAYTVDRIAGTSELQTETTNASKPSELLSVHVNAVSSSEIFVTWKPPKHVNGKLEEFIITWSPLERDDTILRLRDYCKNPMSHVIETINIKPDLIRLSRNKTSCCMKEVETPKPGYEKLCSNHHYHMVPSGFHEFEPGYTCESYFDSYLQSTEPTVENSKSIKEPERSISTKLKEVSEIYLNERLNTNHKAKSNKEEGTIQKVHLLPETKNFTIKGVKHFQDYIVTIEACREKYTILDGVTDTNRCSKRDLAVVRTLQDKKADTISNGVYFEVVNRTFSVTWEAPSKPNGLIVAYELEYRQKDVTIPKSVMYCIPYKEYELNMLSYKYSYSITDLHPGKYEFRVRALSLAGRGPFMAFKSFSVPRPFTVPEYTIVLALMFFIMTGLIIITFALKLLHKKKPNADDILIASINPDYSRILDQWEVPKEDIVLVKEIGSGTFGKVYEGLLQPGNKPCAVKTVNENTFAYDRKVFLNEASIMKSVSGAFHIVQLLGVASREKPPLVIMELMNGGDLRTFLISSRTDPPDDLIKLKIAAQIADGMCFMEAKKFVHRDLAARNCLVSCTENRLIVKIGDFGMTRDIYETDYYRKGDKGLLPIRWMAPESLNVGLFTSNSDVWSYGVVLWEIVTLGEQPYQGFSNETVLKEVMAGRLRLQVPSFCPDPLRTIMTACWQSIPRQRVNFMRIAGALEHFVDEEFKSVSYYHGEEATNTRRTASDYVEMCSVEEPLLSEEKLANGVVMNGGPSMNGGISMLLGRQSHNRFALKLNPVQEDPDSCEDV